MSTSTVVPGQVSCTARTTAAMCAAPPSGRSSRVTCVTTTCRRASFFATSARCLGSSGSSGCGFAHETLQKRQLRVQALPMTMNVAVCFL